MKVTRRTGKTDLPQPKRPTAPRPLPRHRPAPRPALPDVSPRDTTALNLPTPDLPTPGVPGSDENLRRWFKEEAETLQRLAHTQRLKGDYVAAQALEREIRVLASETTALLQAGGTDARG